MNNRPGYGNFQEYCEEQIKTGNSYASKFLKQGKNAIALALEEAKKKGLPKELIERVEERGMLDGSFELTYEGAQRIYKKMQEIITKSGAEENKDYNAIFERFDPIRDSDLIATGMFCLFPKIREKVSNNINSLYKVVLNVGTKRHKGHSIPERRENNSKQENNFLPDYLRELLEGLPKPQSSEDEEYQRMLKVLIEKKAERDVFPIFKHGEARAFQTLEKLATEETNPNIKEAYHSLQESYRNYIDLQVLDVNPNFTDPQTGKENVLPSLHQKIALYGILREMRFGVWDGGGTGKTAIGVLAAPLIEQELIKKGKKLRRVVIVCPNIGKKAWKTGLIGEDNERYLKYRQDLMVINGERKDKDFLKELEPKKWIVLNNEQLTTKVNGSDEIFVDHLIDLGVDYCIFDEIQNLKALRLQTAKGNCSYSAAARKLALSSPYFLAMSATPISNGLDDFAMIYHLLNPDKLPDPSKFLELIQNSPRILYTFFNEKSVRRNSEDINEDLDWREIDEEIEMDPLQRKIYEHLIEFRPSGWLIQARKALLDPRLVDPEILMSAGVLGKISSRNSSKYQRLEELLLSDNGPIAKKEKFIVFSTMFREGVTQMGHLGLLENYEKIGKPQEYDKLELDNTLDKILQSSLRKKFNPHLKIAVIDGTIPVEEREKIVEDLKKQDNLVGIICTTETGGESLNFTVANHTYFLDEDYVPQTKQQAIWRQLRKGQDKKVIIHHFRAKDSLDYPLCDYVDKKRIIAKMATDGVPPTDEEWKFLEDNDGSKFSELIKKSIGGKSIDVTLADITDINDFEIKKRVGKARKSSNPSTELFYQSTDAQKIMQMIGKDPINCWMDKEFVELYCNTLNNLSPYAVHVAKITDLLRRAKIREIEFPRSVISEGSGNSILYDSYQSIKELIKSQGFQVPEITDRDKSKYMLEKGKNPNKILGDMRGIKSPFKENTFDMADNQSISLLRNPKDVYMSLTEDLRIIKPNGLLSLVVQNLKFKDSFYSGLETLGCRLLTEKNQGFSLSRDAFKRIKNLHGEHFAESYSGKLANTYYILAQKIDSPAKVEEKEFWFDNLGTDPELDGLQSNQDNDEEIRDPRESKSIINPRSKRKGSRPKKIREEINPVKEIKVDRFGNVVSSDNIEEG